MQSDSILSSTTTIFFAETVSMLLKIYKVNLGYVSKVGGHNSPSFELCLNMAGCPGLPPPVLSAFLCIIYEVTQRFDCFSCGFEGATPKAVLRVMGVQGITIYHVKSHLQVGLSPLYPSWHNVNLDFQVSVFCGDSNWRKYLTCLNPDVT